MRSDIDFKQKQITSLGSNSGYETYRKDYFVHYLQGREIGTANSKDYYDINSQERLNQLIKDREVSD
jgi:hypothetical protein